MSSSEFLQMSEHAVCACLRVKCVHTESKPGTVISEHWECEMCGTRFKKDLSMPQAAGSSEKKGEGRSEQVRCGCRQPGTQPATDKEKVLKVYPDARCVVATATDDYEHRGYVYWIEGTPFKVKTKFASPEQAWRSAASRLPAADGEEKKIEFEREDDGRWIAEMPSHPGALAYGETKKEAQKKVESIVPASAEGKLPEVDVIEADFNVAEKWLSNIGSKEAAWEHIPALAEQAACRERQLTAALAEIERLKETNRRLNRESQAYKHHLYSDEGAGMWRRYYHAVWHCFVDNSKAKKAEITQLRQSLQTARHDALEEAANWLEANGALYTGLDCATSIRSLQSTEGK